MRTAVTALSAVLAAGVFLAGSAQNASQDEASERATVRRIYDRIQERQKEQSARKTGPYKVTIPNTTVAYEMLPIPAGEFAMGSPASDPRHQPDEQPQHKVRMDAFWMQAHEVTWDEYYLFMFGSRAGGAKELVDAVSRPTRPYVEMSFVMGTDGYPAISMT